ncbi:hypothetical protein [Halomonas campaniensis]|uniref:Uncharacterized protein n=1 Tax=Halomonas campaniensis TaxID=213554 RepID=A0A246S1B5_9GAMM|nr:hypothetical protein [Halomonas campaniensis]OWV30191.1 hypothetical protein JI62_08260 [Halomonas campaniensis]
MFTVNVSRTYKYPVPLTIYDEEGKEISGKFKAVFKVVPEDELRNSGADVALLDQVLVGVEEIRLTDKDGKALEGDELLHAAKNDSAICAALQSAYQTSIRKKNQPRIF